MASFADGIGQGLDGIFKVGGCIIVFLLILSVLSLASTTYLLWRFWGQLF